MGYKYIITTVCYFCVFVINMKIDFNELNILLSF